MDFLQDFNMVEQSDHKQLQNDMQAFMVACPAQYWIGSENYSGRNSLALSKDKDMIVSKIYKNFYHGSSRNGL